MKIDTTRFKASLDENKDKLNNLLATKVRLEAQSNIDIYKDIPKLDFSDNNLKSHALVIKGQEKLFQNNFKELKSTIDTFQIQIKQKEQELIELKNKTRQLSRSLKLINEELKTIRALVNKKVRSNIDLISIKKEYQNARGDYDSARLSIPRAKLSISETKHKILEKIASFKAKSSDELEKINAEIKQYKSKVISQKDKLDKTIIVSPVDGIIKQININTIGGVVRSGVDLIEIVPQSKVMLVEAKIKPKDIAFINPNQKAIVKITAYDFSIYGGLEGKIVEISADSIKDKDSKDGQTYYKVVIQTNKNYLEKDGNKYAIIPGMVASVDIVTGKKTILDFILKPILKTKQSAFHER
jgi:adhesin transport system membrane fusion protein